MPFAIIALVAMLFGCNDASVDHQSEPIMAPADSASLLIFTRTTGWRHDSIEAGVEAIEGEADDYGFTTHHTEDASVFTDDALARYDVVVFLNTTGSIFDDDEQRQALQRFIRNGGGFAGIHSATDTEYEWEWYGALVGAYFDNHPQIQGAVVRVVDGDHASTAHLPEEWIRTDEWYNFRAVPTGVNVLLRLETDSFEGATMGDDHPIAWYHEFEGGRAWYTGGGHTIESYREPAFLRHLMEGIRWAAGIASE